MLISLEEAKELSIHNGYFANILSLISRSNNIEITEYEDGFLNIIRPHRLPNLVFEKEYLEDLYKVLEFYGNEDLIGELSKYIIACIMINTERFLENHLEEIDWKMIFASYSVPITFFEKHMDRFIESSRFFMSGNGAIPLSFFKRHFNEIDWSGISIHTEIPLSFYKENLDKISCWYFLSKNPIATLDFIKENLSKVDEMSVVDNPNVPTSFFYQYPDKINWPDFLKRSDIDISFIKENVHKFGWYEWSYLCNCPSIPLSFFEENLDKLYWSSICRNKNVPLSFLESHIDKVDWDTVCSDSRFPLWFLQKYVDKLNWRYICLFRRDIPVDFYEMHIDKISWDLLSSNDSIPVEFFEAHIDKLYWRNVCQCLPLPFEFWQRHRDKIIWEDLVKNRYLTYEFFIAINAPIRPKISDKDISLYNVDFVSFDNVWKRYATFSVLNQINEELYEDSMLEVREMEDESSDSQSEDEQSKDWKIYL